MSASAIETRSRGLEGNPIEAVVSRIQGRLLIVAKPRAASTLESARWLKWREVVCRSLHHSTPCSPNCEDQRVVALGRVGVELRRVELGLES